MRPKAVGFLHRDVSGIHQEADEKAIRDTARHKHLDLARTFAASHLVDKPACRLAIILARVGADTIIVPSTQHLGVDAATLNVHYRIIETARLGEDPKIWEPHTMMAGAR